MWKPVRQETRQKINQSCECILIDCQNKLWSRSLRERRRRKRISKADVATDSKLEIANDLDIKRRGGKYGKRAEKMEKFSHSLMESTSRKIKKTLKLQYIFIYTLYISIYN